MSCYGLYYLFKYPDVHDIICGILYCGCCRNCCCGYCRSCNLSCCGYYPSCSLNCCGYYPKNVTRRYC